MSTEEIISSLRACGGREVNCKGCFYAKTVRPEFPGCFDQLKLLAAKELEILAAENKILHGRE